MKSYSVLLVATVGASSLWGGCELGSTHRLASLSGASEVPPVASEGAGRLDALLEGNQLSVSGSFWGLSGDLRAVDGSAAHLHRAPAGQNGPRLQAMSITSVDRRSGSLRTRWELSDELIDAFLSGELYVNIYSETHPDGELRAQLSEDQPARFSFGADLSGNKVVPAVITPAHGTISVEVVDETVVVTGSFVELQSDLLSMGGSAASIRQAESGQNGPRVFELEVEAEPSLRAGKLRGAFVLDASQRTAFDSGLYYVEVITVGKPGGELRAQLIPEALVTQ